MAEKKSKLAGTQIDWRASEFNYIEKGILWYGIIGIASAILIIIAFFQKNFFFALFVVISSLVLLAFGKRRPRVLEFRLTETGVEIGDHITHRYENLTGFSFRNRPGQLDELIFRKKSAVNPYVHVPIDEKTAVTAKKFLGGKVPEAEYQESIMDIFGDILGF